MNLQKKRIIGLLDTPFVIAGEDVTIGVQLVDKYTRSPMNVSGATAATAVFFTRDGDVLSKTLVDGVEVADAMQGLFAVALTDTETPLLETGEQRSFQFSVTIDSVTTIVQFVDSLEVREGLFE